MDVPLNLPVPPERPVAQVLPGPHPRLRSPGGNLHPPPEVQMATFGRGRFRCFPGGGSHPRDPALLALPLPLDPPAGLAPQPTDPTTFGQ